MGVCSQAIFSYIYIYIYSIYVPFDTGNGNDIEFPDSEVSTFFEKHGSPTGNGFAEGTEEDHLARSLPRVWRQPKKRPMI